MTWWPSGSWGASCTRTCRLTCALANDRVDVFDDEARRLPAHNDEERDPDLTAVDDDAMGIVGGLRATFRFPVVRLFKPSLVIAAKAANKTSYRRRGLACGATAQSLKEHPLSSCCAREPLLPPAIALGGGVDDGDA